MKTCPNCGTSPAVFDDEGYCIHCWWKRGEPHFTPDWFRQDKKKEKKSDAFSDGKNARLRL